MILHGHPFDRNKAIRESRANELHECAKSNLGSQLSIFDTASFALTTRQNDPPERVDILAFFIQACSPRRALALMTRQNELTRMPSNDSTERFYMGTRTTETKPQGRDRQTSCTNVHNAILGSQLSIFYTGSFTRVRPRPNDPPERVDTDTLKLPA